MVVHYLLNLPEVHQLILRVFVFSWLRFGLAHRR